MITLIAKFGKATKFFGFTDNKTAFALFERGYTITDVDNVDGEIVVTVTKKYFN